MTHPSTRPSVPRSADKTDTDWAARIAVGGAAGFTLLLAAFGLMLYNAWPQMTGVRQTVGSLSAKADRIVVGQEVIARDITTLRSDLRESMSKGAGESKELAVVQARIAELARAVAQLQEQAARLPDAPKPAEPAPRTSVPAPDPEVAELRSRLDGLQRRLDQLAAAPAQPSQPAPRSTTAAPVAIAPSRPNYPVDEIEREVRDMQEVIRQQRANPSARTREAARLGPAGRSAIADPLAPMTSKTPPRIAPVSTVAPARVSRIPFEASSEQAVQLPPPAEPEPRVTRVGVNSAMKTLGPIGLPFDAFGNLFTAIGEGLDHLFTGRTYLPRPTQGEEAATARR